MNNIEKEYTLRQISLLVAKDIGLPSGGYESKIEYDEVKKLFTFKILNRKRTGGNK